MLNLIVKCYSMVHSWLISHYKRGPKIVYPLTSKCSKMQMPQKYLEECVLMLKNALFSVCFLEIRSTDSKIIEGLTSLINFTRKMMLV